MINSNVDEVQNIPLLSINFRWKKGSFNDYKDIMKFFLWIWNFTYQYLRFFDYMEMRTCTCISCNAWNSKWWITLCHRWKMLNLHFHLVKILHGNPNNLKQTKRKHMHTSCSIQSLIHWQLMQNQTLCIVFFTIWLHKKNQNNSV